MSEQRPTGESPPDAEPVVEKRVYFLRSRVSGAIKVGSSGNQPRRQREVQGGNEAVLDLIGTCAGGEAREEAIKAELAAYRTRKGTTEWFWPVPEVAEVVARCLAEEVVDLVLGVVLHGVPVPEPVVRKRTEREVMTEAVRAWMADCVQIGGGGGRGVADGVTLAEAVTSVNWWLSSVGQVTPPGTRTLLHEVIVECMVEDGARWDRHRHQLVGARIR